MGSTWNVGSRRPWRGTDLPHGSISQFQGWTLQRTVNPLVLEAVHANGQVRSFAIDLRLERQAWSWTFIPGAPGHPRSTVAIGTESGVAVFDLETALATRVYAGHSSPVVSLAPSPDGRWLASSSPGPDGPALSAGGLRRPGSAGHDIQGGGPTAPGRSRRSTSRSFAAAMGLLPTDVLVKVGIGWGADQDEVLQHTPRRSTSFSGRFPSWSPTCTRSAIKVRRAVPIPGIGFVRLETVLPTTRRNNPALALFLGTDREWVLWTPQGYYDTSIEGDARFLGWHINPPFRTTRPTDFVPIGTFADAMNRRDVLDRLWRTGVLDQAAIVPVPAAGTRPPTVVAVEDQPPRIVFAPIQGGVQLPAPESSGSWTGRRSGSRSGSRRAASRRFGRRRTHPRRAALSARPGSSGRPASSTRMCR